MHSPRPIKPCFFCFKVDICDEGDRQRRTSAAHLFFHVIKQMFHQKGNASNYFKDFHNLVDLCGPCFKIVDQFCSIYHQLRCVELELNWKLETLSDLMTSADRVPSRVNSFREGQGSGIGIEEGYGGIKGPELFENLMKVRRGLMKQRSSHLPNRVPKLILRKCDLEVEKEPEQVPGGVIALNFNQHPRPTSCQVPKDTQGEAHDGRAPAFFVGWLFSILSVALLSQEDIVRTNTCPNSIPAARFETGQETLVKMGNCNITTDEKHKGVGADGKENCGVGGVEMKPELGTVMEMDDEFAEENSATYSSESDIPSPSPSCSEDNKTVDPMKDTIPLDELNKISSERLKVVHGANLKRQVEHFENGWEEVAEAKEKMPHSRRDLRTIHKCSKCQSTFSNSARLKLHQKLSCQKYPEVNDNSDGECAEDQEWAHIGERDPSLSSSGDEMDCSEEPESVSKQKEEGSASSKTILAQCTAWPPPPLYIDRKKLAQQQPNKTILKSELYSSPSPSQDLQNFRCSDCSETFPRPWMLQDHIVFSHGPGFDATITPAGITFREFAYKDDAQFHCHVEKCSKKFLTQDELDTHSKLHGNFPCSFCEQVDTFAENLALHEASQHMEKSGSCKDDTSGFKCARCPYKAQMKNVFVDHFLETHLGIRNDNAKCPICQISFTSSKRKHRLMYSFYQHFLKHHGMSGPASKDKLYKCDKCPAYFLQLIQLDRHKWKIHSHAKPSSERMTCQDCGKGFRDHSRLWRHRTAIHNAEAKIACSEQGCERMFETDLELEQHKKRAHSGGNPLLQCSVCGKMCEGALQLRRHEATHNPQNKKDDKVMMTCDQCGKSFKEKYYLEIHLLSHSGPQSWLFTCEVCGKKCLTNGKLMEHSRTHSKAKPYVCEICGAAYAHRHNWRIHMSSKHGKSHSPRAYRKLVKSN